jgi:hypothetical protein
MMVRVGIHVPPRIIGKIKALTNGASPNAKRNGPKKHARIVFDDFHDITLTSMRGNTQSPAAKTGSRPYGAALSPWLMKYGHCLPRNRKPSSSMNVTVIDRIGTQFRNSPILERTRPADLSQPSPHRPSAHSESGIRAFTIPRTKMRAQCDCARISSVRAQSAEMKQRLR